MALFMVWWCPGQLLACVPIVVPFLFAPFTSAGSVATSSFAPSLFNAGGAVATPGRSWCSFRKVCARNIRWNKHHIWNTRGYSHGSHCNLWTVPSIDTVQSSTIMAGVIGWLQHGLMEIYCMLMCKCTNEVLFPCINPYQKNGVHSSADVMSCSIAVLIKFPPLMCNWSILYHW